MGYTHYFKNLTVDETFAEAIREFVTAAESHGVRICGGLGDGEPHVGADYVSLNGDGEEGLDHETFYLPSKPEGFNFCKTWRKPYDAVVVASLIWAIVFEANGWEHIGSDGDWEDWVDPHHNCGEPLPIGGVALYEEVYEPLTEDEIAKVKGVIGD